ncbi:MAG: ABC transporter permease [Candidatus Eremiobacteraeota bacterium]|nr:ABC transporter permease [Candidatus Eremiobacteraeota bacterium]
MIVAVLTLREAARRRIFAAVAVLTVLAVGLTAWGMWRIAASMQQRGEPAVEVAGAFAILVLLLAYMFSVVLAVGAAFLSAPAIASDVESGVILAMLPRPIRRSDIVLGKWIALVALLVAYTFAVGAIEFTLIHRISGYLPPHPLRALGFLASEGTVLLTLALLLGTRLSPIAAGITAIVLFGLTWIGGIAQSIALALRNDGVVHAVTALSLTLPTDGLWRGAAYALEPAVLAAAALTDVRRESPFTVGAPPPAAFDWWAFCWVAVVLYAAVVSFQKRDL